MTIVKGDVVTVVRLSPFSKEPYEMKIRVTTNDNDGWVSGTNLVDGAHYSVKTNEVVGVKQA